MVSGSEQMQGAERYLVDEPSVIHECMDGEVLIVNLKDGAYYSLVDCAAFVWNALAAGAGHDEVVAGLERRFEAAPGEVARAIETFIPALLTAGLLRPRADAVAWRDDEVVLAKQPWRAPSLDRYTDIEEHMKVDPVHEVDERGWLAPGSR